MAATSEAPRVGIVFRPQLPPERLREVFASAEAVGLDDVWMWEDCFLEGGLTCAAAALAWSSSLRIGLGLMPAPLRNPALAAMEIATLARLFPGHFIPAVGHGPRSLPGGAAARMVGRDQVAAPRRDCHRQRRVRPS